jgi:hypothetical protein
LFLVVRRIAISSGAAVGGPGGVGGLMIFVEMSIGTSSSNRALTAYGDFSTGMSVNARWNAHHPNRTTTRFTQHVENITCENDFIHPACSYIDRDTEMEKETKERPTKQNSVFCMMLKKSTSRKKKSAACGECYNSRVKIFQKHVEKISTLCSRCVQQHV